MGIICRSIMRHKYIVILLTFPTIHGFQDFCHDRRKKFVITLSHSLSQKCLFTDCIEFTTHSKVVDVIYNGPLPYISILFQSVSLLNYVNLLILVIKSHSSLLLPCHHFLSFLETYISNVFLIGFLCHNKRHFGHISYWTSFFHHQKSNQTFVKNNCENLTRPIGKSLNNIHT